MNVRWEDYVWREPRPVEPTALAKLEADWDVELPKEYKQLAPLYHGMAPTPDVFDMGAGNNAFTCLLTLTSGEHEWVYSIAAAYKLLLQYVPSGIFPFGTTPGGAYLCFDYREAPPAQPSIVLVTTEMDIYPVAPSFREFLEGLHELHA
jgi:hypothetical protein